MEPTRTDAEPRRTGEQRRSAAFFDLDRTLLAGASGPILGEALRAAGVVSSSWP